LLAQLYGSQFVPLAFVLYAMAAVLRERGASLELIGLLPLVGLVWVAKFGWAPLVDRLGSRRFGHYRVWLLGSQALMTAGVLALAPLGRAAAPAFFVAVVVVIAVASATQDIATDAIAVRLVSPAERGMGNGIQKAGGYVGLMAGGGGGLVVYDRFGWVATVILLTALTALPLPALLRFHEPAAPTVPDRPPIATSPIGSFFRRPGTPRWTFVVLPLCVLGMALSLPLLNPLLVDAGWPLARIGLVSLMVGSSIALLCALGTGAVLSVVGRRRALIGSAVAQVAAIGTLLALAHTPGGVPVAVLAVALLNGSYAAAGTVVYTMSMDRSRPEFAGTDFTVQDSLVHLLTQVAGAVGLWTAGTLGYPATLMGALVIATCGAVALRKVFREVEAR
jgi:MFS transporter, PAT family, beta-lactamase induction signal transducer AmpG